MFWLFSCFHHRRLHADMPVKGPVRPLRVYGGHGWTDSRAPWEHAGIEPETTDNLSESLEGADGATASLSVSRGTVGESVCMMWRYC
jgi:hypothetical protein